MAFKTPTFNLKCVVLGDGGAYSRGWSVCQVRGIDSHLDIAPDSGDYDVLIQVLLPRGSDVRDATLIQHTGEGYDYICIGGLGKHYFLVRGVSDKGCGFSNEYRIATGFFTNGQPDINGMPPVDPAVEIPEEIPPLPIIASQGLAPLPAPLDP